MNAPLQQQLDPGSPVPKVSLVGKRILIVDDEEISRRLMGLIMKSRKCHVDTIGDPMEVISSIERALFDYDLAVIDLQLPGISGADLIGRIKKYRPELPVVAISGDDEMQAGVRDITDQICSFFQKPVDLNSFFECVERAISPKTQQAPAPNELITELKKPS